MVWQAPNRAAVRVPRAARLHRGSTSETPRKPYLSELRKDSDQRIAQDRDFAYVREEIERFKKLQAEKSVSLNEAVRLKEKKENDERSRARKKDLASRPEPPGCSGRPFSSSGRPSSTSTGET